MGRHITRRIGLLTALLGAVLILPLFAGAALACDDAFYDHNGSLMQVSVCDGRMVIDYERPRPGLARLGVQPGTVLFRGTVSRMTGGRRISGRAFVFKRRCRPRGYEVNGWMMDGESSFSMEGRAPVRGGNCRVRRHRRDILRFSAR